MVWDITIAQFNPDFNGICPDLCPSQDFEQLQCMVFFVCPFEPKHAQKEGQNHNFPKKIQNVLK